MLTDIGEYVAGAYLKLIYECNHVDYHLRPLGGGAEALSGFDVVGINHDKCVAYLCEVTTHLRGAHYTDNETTVDRIIQKHQSQIEYASKHLLSCKDVRYMFWSPIVPVGYITEQLGKIGSLELIINGEYKKRVDELIELARTTTHDMKNPFFKMLQILEHLRDS